MGMFAAFAQGMLQGYSDVAKERRAKEIADAEAKAAAAESLRDYNLQLDKYTLDLQEHELAKSKADGEFILGLVEQEVINFNDPSVKAFFKERGIEGLIPFANRMDKAENSFGYGAWNMRKPEKWDEDTRADNMLRSGAAWLKTINEVARDEEQWNALSSELSKNDAAMTAFMNDFNKYSDYYVMGMQKENTNPATGVISAYLEPSKGFVTLFEKIDELGQDAVDNSDQVTIENNKDIAVANNAVVFKFRDKDGVEQREAREFDEGTLTSLEAIALNLGYKGDKNTSAVQHLVNNFVDVSRAENADDAYSVLLLAADLEKVGATAFNRTAGASAELAAQVGNMLSEKFGGDRVLMAQAMAPLMTLEEDQFNKNSRLTYAMQPAATYFKKYLDVDVAQVREQYSETQETLRLLNELRTKVGKGTTPTGFVAALKTVFGGAFGEGGQLDQLLGNNTDGVGSQEVLQRAKDLGFISTTVIKDLSEIEAMKLTLAAKMARAIDPSGRLSNQDFEVQLQRLGQSGVFTGKLESLSKLDIVIDDFSNRSSRMTVLNELANASQFGAREARILKANMAVQRSVDASRKGVYSTTDTGSNDEVINDTAGTSKQLMLDSDLGFYTDGTTYYYDEKGTNPVPDSEVDKKLNEVFQL